MRASDLVGQRVRQLRDARGWTARQLAERCADAGLPEITVPVIANIETGRRGPDGKRRRDVTLDEVLALAYVLEVPPILMFLPMNDELTVTPDVEMDGMRAVSWIYGDDGAFLQLAGISDLPNLWTEDDKRRIIGWRRDRRLIDLLRIIYMWSDFARLLDEKEPGWAETSEFRRLRLLASPITTLIDELARRGITPPRLPRRIVEMISDPANLDHPMEYPAELLVADEQAPDREAR